MRTILPAAAAILALLAAGGASAQAIGAPDRACTARSARTADPGEVAASPDTFAGQCVKLQGWWRDIAFYPTRAEAAVVDALSIPLLDNRRLGLYLPTKDLDAAPQAPRLATVVGKVGGACAKLPKAQTDADAGYCHFKGGAFLAVTSIALAK